MHVWSRGHSKPRCCSPQKVSSLLGLLDASARGLPTLHTYNESMTILEGALRSLRRSHAAVTSGLEDASVASTPSAVRSTTPSRLCASQSWAPLLREHDNCARHGDHMQRVGSFGESVLRVSEAWGMLVNPRTMFSQHASTD